MPAPANYIKVKTKIVGGEELIAELKAVGLNVQGTTRKAVRAGAKIIQAQAEITSKGVTHRGGKHTRIVMVSRTGKDQVSRETGEFIRAGTGKAFAKASITTSKKFFYLHFAERGTAAGERTARNGVFSFVNEEGRRIIVKSIHHPGTAAHPWLRPAFDATTQQAEKAYGDSLKQAIETKRALLDNGPEEE